MPISNFIIFMISLEYNDCHHHIMKHALFKLGNTISMFRNWKLCLVLRKFEGNCKEKKIWRRLNLINLFYMLLQTHFSFFFFRRIKINNFLMYEIVISFLKIHSKTSHETTFPQYFYILGYSWAVSCFIFVLCYIIIFSK